MVPVKKHWQAVIWLSAVLALCAGCKANQAEDSAQGSLLKDYVAKPLQKAQQARARVEQRYQQQKKLLDKLASGD